LGPAGGANDGTSGPTGAEEGHRAGARGRSRRRRPGAGRGTRGVDKEMPRWGEGASRGEKKDKMTRV
jgi:hypothetical protein